jgi:hypothetical protein
MSAPDRRTLVDRNHSDLPVRRQCQLLGVRRSSVYRPPPAAKDDDELALMRRIDELFTAWPFLGSGRIAVRRAPRRQSQGGAATDAQDGYRCARPEAAHDEAGARAPDIPP